MSFFIHVERACSLKNTEMTHHLSNLINNRFQYTNSYLEIFYRNILVTEIGYKIFFPIESKQLCKFYNLFQLIEDPLQKKRLQLVFEGISESDNANSSQSFNGFYSLIRTCIDTEQRQVYLIIKFLITLSTRYVENFIII